MTRTEDAFFMLVFKCPKHPGPRETNKFFEGFETTRPL